MNKKILIIGIILFSTTAKADMKGKYFICKPCPAGTYQENGMCKPCPAGTFRSTTATNIENGATLKQDDNARKQWHKKRLKKSSQVGNPLVIMKTSKMIQNMFRGRKGSGVLCVSPA